MGWGQGKPKLRKALPSDMKINAANDGEAATITAYLMYRERTNRRITHKSIDLSRGMFAVLNQPDNKARNAIQEASRYEASFDPAAFEADFPEVVKAVDAALEFALGQVY